MNGAQGIIRDIIYAPNAQPVDMPLVLVIEFPQYTGQELLPGYPKCIPITPFTVQFDFLGSPCTRTQFPIVLSWAMTIHKSQGITLDSAYVDIGSRENGIGCTYVGFSRVKSLKNLYIKSYPKSRYLKSINQSKLLQNRQRAEFALHKLMNNTLQGT